MNHHRSHRRHSKRSVGWGARQRPSERARQQESGDTLIDRAMGRSWPSEHAELLRTATRRTTTTERWYVWRQPDGPWQLGSYAVR